MSSDFDLFISDLEKQVRVVLEDPLSMSSQAGARGLVDRLAVALEASVLLQFGKAVFSPVTGMSS